MIEIKTPQVLTDYTQNQKLYPGEEYNSGKDGRYADRHAGIDVHLVDCDGNECQKAEHRSQEPYQRCNAQRYDGKAQE